MTNDSWLFKKRKWMGKRGFTQVLPVKQEDGFWKQEKNGPSNVAGLNIDLPLGGEYWVSANSDYYRNRGYHEMNGRVSGKEIIWFIHPEDREFARQQTSKFNEEAFRIIPNEIYTALYEGRMVNNFDHAQKGYLRGEGRKAIWEEITFNEKYLRSRAFVNREEVGETSPYRLGFCDVTGATNERTTLAAILPDSSMAGNKVPTFTAEDLPSIAVATSVLNSFVWDAIIRLRVSTTMNYIYLRQIPVPSLPLKREVEQEIVQKVLALSCTTPELATFWNEFYPSDIWSYESAARDSWKRAEIRAELDSIVADLYDLTVPEYARILTGFPLLDREFEPLTGDYFLTEGDEKTKKNKNIESLETPWGIFELKPRSFITRDFALLTYMKRKKYPFPANLHDWFKKEVGIDPEGPLSRFRIGEVRDLEERVIKARELGAIPYVPTSRGGEGNESDDED